VSEDTKKRIPTIVHRISLLLTAVNPLFKFFATFLFIIVAAVPFTQPEFGHEEFTVMAILFGFGVFILTADLLQNKSALQENMHLRFISVIQCVLLVAISLIATDVSATYPKGLGLFIFISGWVTIGYFSIVGALHLFLFFKCSADACKTTTDHQI